MENQAEAEQKTPVAKYYLSYVYNITQYQKLEQDENIEFAVAVGPVPD